MKRIILVLVAIGALAISAKLAASTSISAGNVSGTWTKTGSPYKVYGDITLQSGETLIIEPGVSVEFQGYYEFRINGEIQAVGKPGEMILFTINDPTWFGFNLNNSIGSWNGIYFTGSDNSKFYYCKFQYTKALGAGVSTYWGGAMYLPNFQKDLMIRGCHFENNYAQNNGGAIAVNDVGAFTIDSCIFSNNIAGSLGGAVFAQDGAFYLRNNEFKNNSASEGGAIGFWGDSKIKMYENLIHHNTANSGGAIGVTASTFTAVNNIISNNYASSGFGGAIRTSSTAYPRLRGNLIINNTASSHGGGIFFSGTNAIMTNNTIAYNLSGGSGGGCFLTASSPEIQNTILYFNTPSQLHIGSSTSIPDIYYSDLQGGIGGITGSAFYGAYVENINKDPDFEEDPPGPGYLQDGLGANWTLKKASTCLNSGNPDLAGLNLPELDVYQNLRIRNSLVDQGAAETHIDFITVGGTISSDQYWLADTIRVSSNVTVNDNVTLTINPGSVVQFQNFYQLNIYGRLIAKGNPGDTILFTVPAANRSTGWEGIRIDNSGGNMFDNDSTIIDICKFEYAKKISGNGGAMSINYFSKLRVSNSSFMHDTAGFQGAAIYVAYCSPLIKNNLFSHNHANRGVIASSYGSPTIVGNTIINNTKGELVGGIFGWWSNFVIRDNFIANNEGGIYIFASNTKPYRLVNNVIVNNKSAGITCSGQDMFIVNNTIANNDQDLSFSGANLTIVNSVFAGNGNNSINSNSESIKVYNCLVEGGLNRLVDPSFPNLEQDNNIDGIPQFINPTPGRGWTFPSEVKDWQLYAISPCINAGTNSFPDISFPLTDILGNARVNLITMDIGAIENQNSEPAITSQPIGGINCTGDNIVLSIEVSDTVFYQWQKEGNNIPGANSPSLTIDSLVQTNEGNYRCVIRNAYGTYVSGTVLLIVKESPDLLLTPESQWVRKGSHQTLQVLAAGTRPIRYQWYLDGDSILGANSSDLNFPSIDYSSEGTYHCDVSNVCGTVKTDPSLYYVAPEICMVTVDSVTRKNLIVWEKQTRAELLNYNVYKEGVIAGLYDLIGVVAYDDLSVFVDTVADPTAQAYWYKITATDLSGMETGLDLCVPHKTIHLLTTSNPETGATQLDWDHYIGFNYGTFDILRSTSENNFSVFHSMASSTTTWSDLTGGFNPFFYRISVQKIGDCTPTGNTKAGTGPYYHSLSNMDDNKLKEGSNPPDTILIDNHLIAENNLAGALVGVLSTVDPDPDDVHSYLLVEGEGADNNSSFTLLGNLLLAIESFDYEKKTSYSIRVKVLDQAGNSVENVLVLTILDMDDPVGLNEVFAGQLRVYPNPFTYSTILNFPNPEEKPFTLYIMDLSGKVMRIDHDITGSKHIIERQSLEKGYYLFELRGDVLYRGRFVVD